MVEVWSVAVFQVIIILFKIIGGKGNARERPDFVVFYPPWIKFKNGFHATVIGNFLVVLF